MSNRSRSERIPLLVIGLDGASHRVLDPLADRLPNITRILESGASGVAWSVAPPATFPAWTSILTGAPPERHGIRELLTRDHCNSPLRAVSGAERRVPLLPEQLARAGARVACLGVPGLFPAPSAPGLWISGFDSPGADRALRHSIHPPSLYRELERLGHWRYATFNEQHTASNEAVDTLLDDLEDKRRTILRLHQRQRWDLFFVHLQASDTVCHHFWAGWDRASPRASQVEPSDAIPRVYCALDRLIGELLEFHRGRVLLVSDHGFGGASDVAVYLNRVLAEIGFLRFASPGPARAAFGQLSLAAARTLPPHMLGRLIQTLPSPWTGALMTRARQPSVDFDGSVAFSDELDYAPSIWLRRPLSDREFEQLEHALCSLVDPRTHAPLIARLRRRTGVGPGPDLYIEPAWSEGLGGYRPSFVPSRGPGPGVAVLSSSELRGGRGFGMSGVHHPAGVVAVSGEGIEAQPLDCDLPEIGASIPALMGMPTIAHPDRAEPGLARALGLLAATEKAPDPPVESRRSPVSSASLARLQALGYL